MTIIIVKIALFMLGMFLATEMIAAFCSILDLWYTIKTAYLKVIFRILVWSGITATIAILLGDQWRSFFIWSIIVFLLLFLISFHLLQFVIRCVNRPKE